MRILTAQHDARGRTYMAFLAAGLGLLAALACVPSKASAANISFSNGTATYNAVNGEENALAVGLVSGNKLEFFENGLGIGVAFPTPRCQKINDPQFPTSFIVRCNASGINKVVVNAGDLDDDIDLSNGDDLATAVPFDSVIRGGTNAVDSGDSLKGGAGDDEIYGDAGNDTIDGYEGADLLDGGAGTDDIADSGSGIDDNDRLLGGAGGDIDETPESLAAGDGANNYVDGGAGDDVISLGGGSLGVGGGTAVGGIGEDDLSGGELASILDGGASNDILAGGGGDDKLLGGSGDDELLADGGIDTMDGGAGNDVFTLGSGTGIVDYSTRTGSIDVNTNQPGEDGEGNEKDDIAPEVQGVLGGSGNDSLTGSDADNLLFGNAGNDTLNGAGGTDVLNGGAGSDVLNGGAGEHDTVDYSGATANLTVDLDGEASDDGPAGEGDTVGSDVEDVVGGDGVNTLTGNASANVLSGGSLADAIDGGGGDDVLTGFEGNDTLNGGEGNDGITGGTGRDAMDGGPGLQDWVSYSDHLKAVVVDLDGKTADDGGTEDSKKDTVLGFEGIIGGAGNDRIIAGNDDVANSFVGGNGNDTLDGKGGNDVLDGGAGNDRITGGIGDDKFIGGNNKDKVSGGTGNDRFLMNYDFDSDRITCGAGEDYLRNKAGVRTIDIGGMDKTSKDCEQQAVPANDGPADWWRTPFTMSESLFG